jgi:hypothetical protein
VKLKSGARDHATETRNSTKIKEAGLEKAKLIKVGMLIGSECDNETEPCIVSIAVTEEKEWHGGLLDRTWIDGSDRGWYVVIVFDTQLLFKTDCYHCVGFNQL